MSTNFFGTQVSGMTYSAWRKLHRDRMPEGQFRNRSHPIKKIRLADKTVYQCLRCPGRPVFFKEGKNRIKPPKEKKPWAFRKTAFSFKKSKPMKRTGRIKPSAKKSDQKIQLGRMDALWIKVIKTRACRYSEYSQLGAEEGHLLHAHHIKGKGTWALRFSLDNGVCITGEEHSGLAHSTNADEAAKFEAWALNLRGNPDLRAAANAAGDTDLDEMEFFLKEALAALCQKSLT